MNLSGTSFPGGLIWLWCCCEYVAAGECQFKTVANLGHIRTKIDHRADSNWPLVVRWVWADSSQPIESITFLKADEHWKTHTYSQVTASYEWSLTEMLFKVCSAPLPGSSADRLMAAGPQWQMARKTYERLQTGCQGPPPHSRNWRYKHKNITPGDQTTLQNIKK